MIITFARTYAFDRSDSIRARNGNAANCLGIFFKRHAVYMRAAMFRCASSDDIRHAVGERTTELDFIAASIQKLTSKTLRSAKANSMTMAKNSHDVDESPANSPRARG